MSLLIFSMVWAQNQAVGNTLQSVFTYLGDVLITYILVRSIFNCFYIIRSLQLIARIAVYHERVTGAHRNERFIDCMRELIQSA